MKRRRRSPVLLPAAAAVAAALLLVARPNPSRADATSGITTSSENNPASIEKYGRTWYEYYVTSTSNIATADPNATSPQVIASLPSSTKIEPPDSNLYPNNNSPQTYALTYTDSTGKQQTTLSNSSGFTQSQMVLGLNNNATTGQQLFGLSFFGSGFKATNPSNPSGGGLADIWLSFDQSVKSQPLFQTVTPGGVSIVPVDKSPVAVTTPPVSTTPTPTPAPVTTPVATTPAPVTPVATTPPVTAITPVTSVATPTAPAPITAPTSQVPEPMSVLLWSAVVGMGLLRARAVRRRTV